MNVNPNYQIVKRTDYMILANIENGDLFEINDVVVSTLEQCKNFNTPRELAAFLFRQYADDSDNFGQAEMESFIYQLINDGILTF